MNSTQYSEADLYAVACAGDRHLRPIGAATDAEMALVNACVALEAEWRQAEWRWLEVALPHTGIVDGKVKVVPPAGPPGVKVAIAVYELGWHYPVPRGEECEP